LALLSREADQDSPVWRSDHTPLVLTSVLGMQVVMRQLVRVEGVIRLTLAGPSCSKPTGDRCPPPVDPGNGIQYPDRPAEGQGPSPL
jgi:hypothetical protein